MTITRTAEALFTSYLQSSDHPTVAEALDAAADSVQRHGGALGCTAACAAEYGEHPAEAANRMRWALSLAHRIEPVLALAA